MWLEVQTFQDFDQKKNESEESFFQGEPMMGCLEHHNDIHHFIPEKYREQFFRTWMEGPKNQSSM